MKFRKRPVVIEALQFLGNETAHEIICWANPQPIIHLQIVGQNVLLIPTLEGEMNAQIGDWIIKGVNGEFYPCKPDIFEKTYEEVKGE